MKSGLFQMIKRAFGREPALHPIERKMAKRWTKQRLTSVFPELRQNPAALEQAYQSLSLTPREGDDDEAPMVFELTMPELR